MDNQKKTIIELALRQFRENLKKDLAKVNLGRHYSSEFFTDRIFRFNDIFKSYVWLIIVLLGVIILPLWLTVFSNSANSTIGGKFINAVSVWGIACAIYLFIIFIGVYILAALVTLFTPMILFSPMLFWAPFCAAYNFIITLLKLLLLIPLTILVIVSRMVQLYRRIFYVCPYRGCSYRGYPTHICPECGADNKFLWPNLYGILKHECVNCNAQLPTLYHMGRKDLIKRCGRCGMQLIGKHAGRIPVRQIGLIGGSLSGKTNYLLMAVHQILSGRNWITGSIDDTGQAREFDQSWNRLEQGIAAEKTVEVQQAFMLYSRINNVKNQLYLYDSPGEDFASISGMSVHQYFGMMEGCILMVDPTVFCVGNDAERQDKLARFYAVVQSALNRILQERYQDGRKIAMRVAIVITKADMPWVANQIGDVRSALVPGETCRQAIDYWGCGNLIRSVENYFEYVEYFACSALGRDADISDKTPFREYGVMEPLRWVLSKNER